MCELRWAPAVCPGVSGAPDGGLTVPVAARVLDLVVLTHVGLCCVSRSCEVCVYVCNFVERVVVGAERERE